MIHEQNGVTIYKPHRCRVRILQPRYIWVTKRVCQALSSCVAMQHHWQNRVFPESKNHVTNVIVKNTYFASNVLLHKT